jgi:hypothetical protein
MTLDRIKTGSGKQLRTSALTETALPVPYNAAAMPGSTVLGTDGRLYASTRDVQGSYVWSGIHTSDINQSIRRNKDDSSSAALFLRKTRGSNPVLAGDRVGAIWFQGRNGAGGIANCGAIRCQAATTSATLSIATNLDFFYGQGGLSSDPGTVLSPDGEPVAVVLAMRISSVGNVLINNTTGTERLSVTGNIQLTDTADSYRVGTNNVVGSRKTGWAAPTGTATRTTFDTATVAVADLAQRVKALIDDLTAHGLVGA